MSNKPNIPVNKKLSRHEYELKAERTLLAQTINLTPEELEDFLRIYAIPREEYDLILHKHRYVVERLKEELNKETK